MNTMSMDSNEISVTTLPEIGDDVPRRGNRLTRNVSRFIMSAFGWRIVGEIPNQSKLVAVGAPHTSNRDFFMSALTALALGIEWRFVMKSSVFRGAAGGVLRWFGGIGIDRNSTQGFVQGMVDQFEQHDSLLLAIMPEGTRSVVDGWRSGFYYIASGAGVPLLMIAFDYGRHEMRFGPTFEPTGDYEADLPIIQSFFADAEGYKGERMLTLPPADSTIAS